MLELTTIWYSKLELFLTWSTKKSLISRELNFLDGIWTEYCGWLWDHSFKTLAIFHNFWPLPLYHRHSSKMLMKGILDPYVLWPFDHRPMWIPLPPKTCWRLKWMVPFWNFFLDDLGIFWTIVGQFFGRLFLVTYV